jgi:hypothetical protein
LFDAKANAAYFLGRGRCPQCSGARPVLPGKKRCAECTERNRVYNLNRTRAFRSAGKCVACGAGLEKGWHKRLCPTCNANANTYVKKYRGKKRDERHERMRFGVCVDCGEREPVPGRRRCAECIDKRNKTDSHAREVEKLSQIREYRKANGLCLRCGNPVAPGHRRCEKCMTYMRDYGKKLRLKEQTERMAEKARSNRRTTWET